MGDFEVWQSESADTTGATEPVFFVAVNQLGVGGWWSLERFCQNFQKESCVGRSGLLTSPPLRYETLDEFEGGVGSAVGICV